MRKTINALSIAALFATVLAALTAPVAANGTVIYTGQGTTTNGDGSVVLNLELCGVANGANVDGSYLLWVFTGGKNVTSAAITIDGQGPFAMTKKANGAFQYISGWYDLASVTASVTYAGTASGNPQLVISHGCAPFADQPLVWCSPGYWLHATDAAWTLVSPITKDDKYNSLLGTMQALNPSCSAVDGDPSIFEVLNSPSTYGGAATNCVAALLTDALPGYGFDPNHTEDNCPFDHFGNLK